MKIQAHIDQIDRNKWQKLLDNSSYSSCFQTPEFFDFYNSLTSCFSEVFAVEERGEYISLVVVTVQKEKGLKAFFSRRAIVYGGIVLLDDKEEDVAAALLLSYLKKYFQHKAIYVEIRNNFNYQAIKSSVSDLGFDYIPWLNYQFDGVSPQSFLSGMKKPRLRQLKKALNDGITWREANSIDDVKDFYDILFDLYRYKVKKPLPSFDFFEQLYHTSFAECLVVEKNGKIIGGVMCLIYSSEMLYEFYICGLDKEVLDAHPSIVAMWAMVEYAQQNGIKSIDLMGAGQSDKPSSVRDFKSRFGGELVGYGRFILVCNRFLYALGRFYLSVIR